MAFAFSLRALLLLAFGRSGEAAAADRRQISVQVHFLFFMTYSDPDKSNIVVWDIFFALKNYSSLSAEPHTKKYKHGNARC